MKNTNSEDHTKKQEKDKWVEKARLFGEECLKIQRDSNIDLHDKLDKQIELSKKISKEVKSDTHLTDEDKKNMLQTIDSYITDYKEINQVMQQAVKAENSQKQTKSKS